MRLKVQIVHLGPQALDVNPSSATYCCVTLGSSMTSSGPKLPLMFNDHEPASPFLGIPWQLSEGHAQALGTRFCQCGHEKERMGTPYPEFSWD